MTIQERIAKAVAIRKSSTFNRKSQTLKVNGHKVDSIPCYRCGGVGKIRMGNDAFAGTGRCGVCQGRKSLTGADVERNLQYNAAQVAEIEQSGNEDFAKYDKLMAKAAAAGDSANG